MRKTLLLLIVGTGLLFVAFRPVWGFFAHERINRLAVFTLPAEMIGFYKKNIHYIEKASVNPDKRRYAMEKEAARHYLDADHYGDSALAILPRNWKEAVEKHSDDTLQAYGILPWHLYAMFHRLKDAFMVRDPALILKVSAELGHYIADAHVPLHTTENYNGQLTGQEGIHGFWESRLPEVYASEYDFFVGKAQYVQDPQGAAWKIIAVSHGLVKKVLEAEKDLAKKWGAKKYAFETRGKSTVKVYALEYAQAYHEVLNGMVEQQMRNSIKMIGDFWYTAWIDAGQPDIQYLRDHTPTENELIENRQRLAGWKRSRIRAHE
jgi:hypothetical protein